jgi:hypothetical protein
MGIKTGLAFLFLTILEGESVMKNRLILAVVLCFAVLSAPCVHAEMYGADVAVKVDYFHFSDSLMKNLNLENGVYVGIEAYKQLFCPNLYFGVAVGWAGTSGSVSDVVTGPTFLPTSVTADSSIDYIPIEFNVKYVIPISRCFNFAVGGGGSINHFSFDSDISAGNAVGNAAVHVSDDDWVWGGQVFGEVNYKVNNWFIGIDAKYQLTQDLNLFGVDSQAGADNFRAGGRVGFLF